MTAAELRALARCAIAEAGARGFVRFAPEGDSALLLSDAPRLCADGEARARLGEALEARGFDSREHEGLLLIMPRDALLMALADGATLPARGEWEDSLAPAYTLADRWLRAQTAQCVGHAGAACGEERAHAPNAAPLTQAGRQLALETARLLWRPQGQVLAGLAALRARAAVLQRGKDASALRLCGGMLANWLSEQRDTGRSTI